MSYIEERTSPSEHFIVWGSLLSHLKYFSVLWTESKTNERDLVKDWGLNTSEMCKLEQNIGRVTATRQTHVSENKS